MAKAKEESKVSPEPAKGARGKNQASGVQRTADLSEQVLEHVETGQRGAVKAVRGFIGSVRGEPASASGNPAKRRGVIDSTLEMTDRLVQVEYEFVRNVVHSAGESLDSNRGSQ